MIARASQLFLPTLREDPADAEAASHKLLVRGGFIRQVGAGLWTFLPLGWRVHQKVVQIIREEMNAIGGPGDALPVLTPAELWEKTGRDRDPRGLPAPGRLGPPLRAAAHARGDGDVPRARDSSSYKELPQLWYHFSSRIATSPGRAAACSASASSS